MLRHTIEGSRIHIETSHYQVTVETEGYVSGVKAGSFVDKKTGARDLGFGLSITDFLLEPAAAASPEPDQYALAPKEPAHGNIAKRYVEGPQICTQAKKLPYEVIEGDGFLVVKQWYRYHRAYPPYPAGSRWEQVMVFPDGLPYFFSSDRVTSVNDHPALILRIDMPGHIKGKFEQVYLSYLGKIPAREFLSDFPPNERFFYRRPADNLPERIIRGYQVNLRGEPGPWLVGMTLSPADVYEAWCHARGYVCLIEEIGGRPVKAGGTFGACYCIGWFHHPEEMDAVYDMYRGISGIVLDGPVQHPKAYVGRKQEELPPVRAIAANPGM